MRINVICLIAATLSILVSLSGCGKKDENRQSLDDGDVLVTIGDSSLRVQDVLQRMPGGLSDADSTAMFDAIVNAWVERLLLEDFGRENIEDMDRIERLTSEYRARLIVESYRKMMRENRNVKLAADSIKSYYAAHKEDFVLERPVVKGLYLKIPSDANNLAQIRKWMKGATDKDIDNLEKSGLNEALKFSFFEDRWVDWQNISDNIPYRFYDPNAFVESTKDFETEDRGSLYLLHISSYIPAGEVMPEEVAYPIIEELLDTRSAADYERSLLKSLGKKAMEEGRLKLVAYPGLSF
ncbi:MAG: peptidylprolyl isomerase [Muribaculum sp.]|nr:peptidylprolyl isomerase [Muribaculum sp.]